MSYAKIGDVARLGLLGAICLAFIALAGMPVGLDARVIIDPNLTLGHLSLVWLPLVLGWVVGREVVLEGMEGIKRGVNDILSGGLTGLVSGLGLSLLVLLVKSFDLRDPLVNWSPQTLDFLSLERSFGLGVVAWPMIGAVLGALGGALHVLPAKVSRAAVTALVAVISISTFEDFLVDLIEPLDVLFASSGGLTIVATLVVIAVAAGTVLSGVAEKVGEAQKGAQSKTGPERARRNALYIFLATLALIIIPIFTGKITQELLANIGLFLLLALGLNIVVGLAGILDLGYVAFFAVGGYTTAVLTSPNRGPRWPDWFPLFDGTFGWLLALGCTVIVATIAGLFIGAPVIRMRGDYLAVVTLGFGEIIRILVASDWLAPWFNGAQGITNVPPADFGVFEVKGTDPRSVFYLVMVFAAISIYVSWRLERSRLGRAWMAIREDESVAEAMGINTVNVKLMAFVVGAVLASFSGAIFSAKVGSVFPSSFLILVSIIILVIVIVGGMGNILGVIAGSVVLVGILGGPKQPGLLQEFSEYKLLIYGVLLVWVMLQRPEGLVPNVRRSRELHQDEFLQDAWLKGEVDDKSDHDDWANRNDGSDDNPEADTAGGTGLSPAGGAV